MQMNLKNFVDLVTDCSRRDLTINSMALDSDGNYVDPFDGLVDLNNKVLRHTSNAFSEDPVRVLRLARFRARFGADWTVAPETVSLMAAMSKSGVLSELTAERVWKELSRALMEKHPRVFFDTLLEADCLHTLFPEVYKLLTALESRKYHPEGNSYSHTMLVLTRAAHHGFDLDTRFACLVHDFGKSVTPFHKMPAHHGHDVAGVPLTEAFANRLCVPAKTRDLAMKATRFHMYGHLVDNLTAKAFVKLFTGLDAWRDKDALDILYQVMVCDRQGRLGHEDADFSSLNTFYAVWDNVKTVKFSDVFPNGEKRVDVIKNKMYQARVKAAST
jgi:tRNA nucleotidyltransferase (CCA-adding enzyme)